MKSGALWSSLEISVYLLTCVGMKSGALWSSLEISVYLLT